MLEGSDSPRVCIIISIMTPSRKRRRIWKRDGGICGICHMPVPFGQSDIDHVIPRAFGGEGLQNNLQIAHRICNAEKGQRTLLQKRFDFLLLAHGGEEVLNNDGNPAFVQKLLEGNAIQFRPRGHSMRPKILSGQLVTIEPAGARELEVGQIVYAKVSGALYVHLIKALNGDRVLIGNNHGRLNGWTPRRKVYGIVTKVED